MDFSTARFTGFDPRWRSPASWSSPSTVLVTMVADRHHAFVPTSLGELPLVAEPDAVVHQPSARAKMRGWCCVGSCGYDLDRVAETFTK